MHVFGTVGGCQSTRREPTHTRGEHANSTQKGPSRELNHINLLIVNDIMLPHSLLLFLEWQVCIDAGLWEWQRWDCRGSAERWGQHTAGWLSWTQSCRLQRNHRKPAHHSDVAGRSTSRYSMRTESFFRNVSTYLTQISYDASLTNAALWNIDSTHELAFYKSCPVTSVKLLVKQISMAHFLMKLQL